MAEFCLECWNKINNTHLNQKDVILSEETDFCEECQQMKQVIICMKEKGALDRIFWNLFRK